MFIMEAWAPRMLNIMLYKAYRTTFLRERTMRKRSPVYLKTCFHHHEIIITIIIKHETAFCQHLIRTSVFFPITFLSSQGAKKKCYNASIIWDCNLIYVATALSFDWNSYARDILLRNTAKVPNIFCRHIHQLKRADSFLETDWSFPPI